MNAPGSFLRRESEAPRWTLHSMQKIEMQSEVRSNRLHLMVTTGANRFNFKIEFCSSLTDAMIKKNARQPRFRTQFDMTISPIAPRGARCKGQDLCDLVRCCAILCEAVQAEPYFLGIAKARTFGSPRANSHTHTQSWPYRRISKTWPPFIARFGHEHFGPTGPAACLSTAWWSRYLA